MDVVTSCVDVVDLVKDVVVGVIDVVTSSELVTVVVEAVAVASVAPRGTTRRHVKPGRGTLTSMALVHTSHRPDEYSTPVQEDGEATHNDLHTASDVTPECSS
mmetsp:Transcript_118188/g.306918  ORF Transcript_118188/g.306918 Transcript_118188/m.306918 type:complete len:103 (+) Transcript_118188:562-870(+)